MRLLAVIGGELAGADERSDWAVLDALVASNGTPPLEIQVMALIHRPRGSLVFAHPLSRAVGVKTAAGSGMRPSFNNCYDPAERARHRLERALQFLRGLGLRATGDVEPDDAYHAVRREAARGQYHRVLILHHDRTSWKDRFAGRSLAERLRKTLDIPVDALGRPDLAPPLC